jgi:hypothetical protein
MARTYGEGFQKPIDYETGAPVQGAPLIGVPSTNRPWRAGGNGYITLLDDDDRPVAPKSGERM